MIWRRWVTENPSSATKARSEHLLLAQRRACVRRPRRLRASLVFGNFDPQCTTHTDQLPLDSTTRLITHGGSAYWTSCDDRSALSLASKYCALSTPPAK